MEFKRLCKDGRTIISVANVGNDCVMSKINTDPYGEIITDALIFIPRMNIDCECDPPKLKVTGIGENATQSYTFTDENVMVGEFTKAIMDKQKENEVQEVE